MNKKKPKPKAKAVKPRKCNITTCDVCGKKTSDLTWAYMTSMLVCSRDCAKVIEQRIEDEIENQRIMDKYWGEHWVGNND